MTTELADGAATPEWWNRYTTEHPRLIHVTSPDAAAQVWADGIRPGVGDPRAGADLPSRRGAVYLADDRWAANGAANLAEFVGMDGQEYAVVEVDTSALDRARVVPDEDSLMFGEVDAADYGIEPPSEDDLGEWADRVRLGSQPGITEASIDDRGTLAHLGPIPPEAITAIHVYDRNGERLDDRTLTRGEFNDLPNGPAIAATTSWYDARIDGQTIAPRERTAEPPTYVLAARDRADGPLRPIGYSTAATEADALADAEAAAPYAAEVKVGRAHARTTEPPNVVRATRRRDLDIEADGLYRDHESVTVNGAPVGVIRRRSEGPDDTDGPVTALVPATGQEFGPFLDRQDAIDALVEHHESNPRADQLPSDTQGTTTRQALPVEAASVVVARVNKLNERAARKGLDGRVEVTVSEPYVATTTDELGNSLKYMASDVTVTTQPVRLGGGWTFAGTVDFKTMRDANPSAAPDDPNMVLLHSTSDFRLPESFRSAAVCDDCGRAMPRNKLIVAADADGNLTRLGTTCVRDVLGHDPTKLLWFSEATDQLMDDDESGAFSTPPRVWEVDEFVTSAFVAADAFGWVKSGYSEVPTKGTPTAMLVRLADERPTSSDPDDLVRFREYLTDADRVAKAKAKADAAIEYVKSDAFPQRSEYEQNLRRAIGSEIVTHRTAGTAASLVSVWNRHTSEQAARVAREQSVPNEWIGQVGDKVEMTGTIRTIRTFASQYGDRDIITVDTDRGVVKTFTDSGSGFAIAADKIGEGGTIRFKGTVKEHDEFPKGSGQKETALARVAHVPTRLDKLRDAEAQRERDAEWEHSSAVNGVTQIASQAAYSIDPDTSAGSTSPDRAAWLDGVRAAVDALPTYRVEQILDDARKEQARLAEAYPVPVSNSGLANGVDARAILSTFRAIPDGATLGYPYHGASYPDAPHNSVIDERVTGLVKLRRTSDTVDLVDPDTGDVVVSHAELQALDAAKTEYDRLPSSERYREPRAPQPPVPTLRVVGVPDVTAPWNRPDGYDVSVSGRRYHLDADGTSTPPPYETDNPWSQALDEGRRSAVNASRAGLREWIDDTISAPYDPVSGPDGDVLTADNLAQLATPVEVTKGRKVYRIDTGGDVYTVPDGKRVTDKTADPILRQALLDAGFEAPPAVIPEPPRPAVAEFNDLPERPGPREVGSHEVAAATASPTGVAYRQALAAEPTVRLIEDAWQSGDLASPGATRAVHRAAAAVFNLPTPPEDTAAEDASILRGIAERNGYPNDPGNGLRVLHAAAQDTLADAGIAPDDTLNLYRGVTSTQAADYDLAGRPERIASAPLAAFSTSFTDAARDGAGGVVTVQVPAANVVSLGAIGALPNEVLAHPDRDGAVTVVRYRSPATDAAAAAVDIEVGEVLVATNGVKVLRTPSGFVDQATGNPVHADGTPIT